MQYVYALELKEKKYYVGLTGNPDQRIKQHSEGRGSAWTKKYPVLKVLFVKEGDAWDEEKGTLALMSRYGVQNVRGGSYSRVVLPRSELNKAMQQIASVESRCFFCNSKTHLVSDCKKARGARLSKKPQSICSRCGRPGHKRESCYAKTSAGGKALSVSCSRCGRIGHKRESCYAKTNANGKLIQKQNSECIII